MGFQFAGEIQRAEAPIARTHRYGEWFFRHSRDEVNHTGECLTAIERRCWPFDDFYLLEIVHQKAVQVERSRRASDDGFAVEENERIIGIKSLHLNAHAVIGYDGQPGLFGQQASQIYDARCIDFPFGNDLRLDGRVFDFARRFGACDNNRRQCNILGCQHNGHASGGICRDFYLFFYGMISHQTRYKDVITSRHIVERKPSCR